MSVVNIRDGKPYDEWIGGRDRKRGLGSSIFNNPYRIGGGRTREQSIGCFFWYLVEHPEIVKEIPRLYGKILCDASHPLASHGDLLVHLAKGRFPDVNQERWFQLCTECLAPSYFWREDIENPAQYVQMTMAQVLDPSHYTYLNGNPVLDQSKVFCPCCQVLTGAMFDAAQMRYGTLRMFARSHLRKEFIG